MRVAIFGTGAVGGYYGGRLAQAGETVIFIARGENLRVLREKGLQVESTSGSFHLKPVHAVEEAAEVGPVDVVIVCTKTWQLPAAFPALRQLTGPETFVVPLLNGVEAPFQIDEALGPGHACGGIAKLFSALVEPGKVVHSGGPGYIAFAELDSRPSERTARLLAAFQKVGVPAEIPADIQAALWEKFMFITAFASVGAVTRAPVGVLRSLPETRAMLEESMREIMSVGRARGVHLVDEIIPRTLAFFDAQPAPGMASMQRDVLNGRRSELDALTGAVVRLGKESGVPTPLHDVLFRALLPQELRARAEMNF